MSQAPLPFGSGRRNLFIEAGAGTGKTTEIVRRVLTILLEDPSQAPERIVLITFTEKAAGEIAERIRDALIDLRGSFETGRPGWPSGAAKPILAVPAGSESAWKAACERHLEQLDTLRSQTIHSFCQSILAQFPFEARLDPAFRIVEGFERARILDRIWADWVRDETAGDPAPEIARQWELAVEALMGLDGVRGAMFELLERRSVAFDDAHPLSRFEIVEPRARQALETIRERPAEELARVTDRALGAILEHLRAGDGPPQAVPANGTDAWIAYLEPIAPWLRQVDLPKLKELAPIKEAFRLIRGEKKENNLYDLLAGERAAHAVHAMARRFAARVEREKDARGVLDFDDLLIRTERLLREPAVAEQVRRRFDFIFVDEFQDTDRLQAHIVERLARDAQGGFSKGRVVLVGDPKQSIYSFRHADPETYGAMLELFVENGAETPKLQQQFRSHPDLVDALNAMFAALFAKESEPNVYRPGYTRLEPGLPRDRGGAGAPRIRMLRAADEGDEAAAIAVWLGTRIAEGAAPEEFAILLRKMTDVDAVLDALDRAGIEYALPRNTPLLDRRAAIDLLALLRAIAAPHDRAAEISAARGPWFALTDQEIAADYLLRESGGQPEDSPWQEFRRVLWSWRDRARRQSVAETLEMVVAERGIETTLRLVRHGEEMLRDLEALRDVARTFDRDGGGSLALFVDDMLRRREGGELDQAVLEEGAPGVKILTVHASKGLEFGTVILPYLGAATAGDSLAAFTLETPTRLYFKGRLTTAGTLLEVNDGVAPADVHTARAEAEVERLFYVAVTRARSEVVFVLDPADAPNRSFFKPFYAIFPFDRKQLDPLWPAEPGERVEEIAIGPARVPVAFVRVEPRPEAAARRSHLAAPEIEPLLDLEPGPAPGPGPGPDAAADRGDIRRRAAALAHRDAGLLLHRFLEIWNGETNAVADLLPKLVAEAGATPAAAALVRRRIDAVLASSAWRRIREAELVGAEATLWVNTAGGAAERRIDRLMREDGAWLVLDYKSGTPSANRLEVERAQVAEYCRAIEATTGETCRGLLWYIDVDADEVVEV